MSGILVIQNASLEGPGILGKLLESDGFSLRTVYAKKEKIPSLDHAAVMILGGPESANDDLPYLKDEMVLIQQCVDANVPVLGICLGSQLMAKTLGASVYSGPKKEMGFYHDIKVDAAKSHLFDGIKSPFTVFHWHGDTFDLPNGAQRLAHSDTYEQAFKYGSAVGLQFHLEVDAGIVLSWLDNTKEDICLPYIDPNKIRSDVEQEMPKVRENMELFYKNFRSEFDL